MSGYNTFFKQARTQKSSNAQVRISPPVAKRTEPKIKFSHDTKNQTKTASNALKPNLQVEILRQQIQARRASENQKKLAIKAKSRSATQRLAIVSALGLMLTWFGYEFQGEIGEHLNKIQISAFSAAQAESVKEEPKKAAAAEAPKAEEPVNVDHLKKLVERKKSLDEREAELARLEAELEKKKTELDERFKSLDEMRAQIAKTLEQRVQSDDKKVDALVQVYTNMKPQQAARVLETMDETLVVDLLGRMKKKNAAEIMNLLNKEKAKVISERYAGYTSATPP